MRETNACAHASQLIDAVRKHIFVVNVQGSLRYERAHALVTLDGLSCQLGRFVLSKNMYK